MTDQFKTILLLGLLSAVLVGFGSLLGPSTFYLMTALAVLMNLGAYFFSDRVVLRLHGAREVSCAACDGRRSGGAGRRPQAAEGCVR